MRMFDAGAVCITVHLARCGPGAEIVLDRLVPEIR
jgi:hypothetical protein